LISDSDCGQLLRLNADGTYVRVAGLTTTPDDDLPRDGLPATQAFLKQPQALVAATDGTVFIAEHGPRRIRALMPDGTLRTAAGGGSNTTWEDDVPANDVYLRWPVSIGTMDAQLVLRDRDHGLRILTADGRLQRIGAD